jgi:predicted AAA+ superfamily ATPase
VRGLGSKPIPAASCAAGVGSRARACTFVRKTGTHPCGKQVLTFAGNRCSRTRKKSTLEVVADQYVSRIVDGLLDEVLTSFPAVSLVGPRAAGKTTTALRRGGTAVRLDRPEVRQSVAASPDAILAGVRPPVVIDEWQEVPDVLGAVKRLVDEDPVPGRFILTGSIRAELENQSWPGTGRVLQIPMYGMSVGERLGRAGQQPFIDRVLAGGAGAVAAPDTALNVRDYLDLILTGSFPEPALRMPGTARRRWFAGYVEQMITRDVPAIAPRRDPELLRRYLSALAINTAGVVADATLRAAAGINAKTAQAYQSLFQRMFVLDLVPAWFSNRIKRLVKSPKRYLVDPALVTAVLGLGREAILFGPDMLGRLLDTFIAAQLRAELAASAAEPRLYHLREEQGRREVDLIIETADSRIIGIEIKAAATANAADARHLAWLRDQIGSAFSLGIVLHTGPHVFRLDDRLIAAPVSSLWTP